MRIAAETAHDGRMLRRPLEGSAIAGVGRESREQFKRALLDRRILGVLERQVEEPALERVERALAARVHDGDRGGERFGVARERPRRVAERVARELVEQQYAGEVAPGFGRPFAERATERRFDGDAEAGPDRRVERGVLAKPFAARRVRQRAEPESESCLRDVESEALQG